MASIDRATAKEEIRYKKEVENSEEKGAGDVGERSSCHLLVNILDFTR